MNPGPDKSDAEIAELVERGYTSKSGKIKCQLDFETSWINNGLNSKKKLYGETMRLICDIGGVIVKPKPVTCRLHENAKVHDNMNIAFSEVKSDEVFWSISCAILNFPD